MNNMQLRIKEKEEQFNKVVEEMKKREESIATLKEEIRQLEVQAYQIQGAAAAYVEIHEALEAEKKNEPVKAAE